MKNIAAIAVFLLLGFLSSRYFGIWWDIAVIGFVVSLLFRLSPGWGFGSLFIGGVLLWGGMTYFTVLQSDSTLGAGMARVFNFSSPTLFILVISMIGGMLAGLSGWSAASLNRLMQAKKG